MSAASAVAQKLPELQHKEINPFIASITDTIDEPFTILDTNFKVLSANKQFYDVFKVTPEETIGQFIYDVGNRQFDIPKLHEFLEKVLPKNTVAENYQIEHSFQKAGSKILLINAKRIDELHVVFLGVRDVTEYKRLELLKTEGKERYEALFLASRDAIMTISPPSWKFTSCNPATLQMFGIQTEKEFLTYEPWQLSPETQPDGKKSDEKEKEHIEIAMREGTNSFEWTHMRITGETFLANVLLSKVVVNEQVFLQAVVRDISKQTLMESRLKEYEKEKFKVIFNTTSEGILIVDEETKKFLMSNNAICSMLGYSQDDMKDLSVLDIHPKEALPFVLDQFNKLTKAEISEAKNIPVKRKDGSIFFADIRASVLRLEDRTYLLGVFRDISASKQIAEALQSSEEKYRTLVDHINDGIFIIQDEKLQFINDSFASIVGHTVKEVIGKKFQDFIAPEYLELVKKRYQERQHGKKGLPKDYEIKINKKDGTKIDVLLSVGIITYNGKVASMGVLRDISERKKNEKALQEKEQFLRQVIDLVPHFIFAKDLESRFILVNKAVSDAYGSSPQQLVGKSDIDFSATPEQAKHFHEDDLAVISGGTPKFIAEEPIKDAKGNTRYLQTTKIPFYISGGAAQGLLGVSVDITEQKKLREKILEDKLKDDAMLESIGDAVFACNKEGTIMLFNKMAEKLTGVSNTDAVGKKYSEVLFFIKEINGAPCEDFIKEALKTNKITKMVNHTQLLRKDGSKISVADSAAPIRNSQGETIGCVVAFHDVTHEREIDKAKTEFVSLASHQLRTPLTVINWYVETLLADGIEKFSPKQQEYLKASYSASKRMVYLIDALLNVSRLELGTFSIEPENCNVQDLAKICIQELLPLIQAKKILIHEQYHPDTITLQVDRKLFGIVITNLLSNALKYTPSGGVVNMFMEKQEKEFFLTVTDSGIGIPIDQQDKIFTKLYRADNAVKTDPDGTGLGLYIVRSIITNSGGKVWFESRVGETVFHVSLPASGMSKKVGTKQLV